TETTVLDFCMCSNEDILSRCNSYCQNWGDPTCARTHTHTHTHTCARTHTHAHTHSHTHTHTHTHTRCKWGHPILNTHTHNSDRKTACSLITQIIKGHGHNQQTL